MPCVEDALIRRCVSLEQTPQGQEEILVLLRFGIDWRRFLRQAQGMRVAALLHKALLNNPSLQQRFPPQVLQELYDTYYTTLHRNMVLYHALREILEASAAAGVPAIVFKGLVLAELAYGDIGVRPMADVDILVQRQDLGRFDSILRTLGYSAGIDRERLSGMPYTIQRNSFSYQRLSGVPMQCHLYWHLVNFLLYDQRIFARISLNELWKASEYIESGELTVRTFSPQHHLLYLCLHALHNSFNPLLLLCDINAFIRRNAGRIDWDILWVQAQDFGLSKYLFHGLNLSQRVLGTPLPPLFLQKIKPQKISLIERRFAAMVVQGQSTQLDGWLVYVGMNETFRGKMWFLRNAVFPSKEELAVIKQKDVSQVTAFDYTRRAWLALCRSVGILWSYLRV